MKNIYLFLVMTAAMIFVSKNKSVAQQILPAATGSPVVVSKNGKYTICVEGFLNEKEAKNFATSISITRSKSNVKTGASKGDVTSGVRKTTVAATENLGKTIKYGPWKMLNNFKIPSYSFEDYFYYGSKGRIEAGGSSGKGKQIKYVLPDQSSILKLNQNAQITVVLGQQYSIQVGHFTFDKSAVAVLQKISAITTMPVLVIIKNGFYSILIEGFSSWNDAKLFVGQLDKLGFKGTIVKVNKPVKVVPATI
jgi:hypothetical protein